MTDGEGLLESIRLHLVMKGCRWHEIEEAEDGRVVVHIPFIDAAGDRRLLRPTVGFSPGVLLTYLERCDNLGDVIYMLATGRDPSGWKV